MRDTPLISVIRALGKRERNDLLRWVESAFVNRRPEVTRLYRYLCEQLPTGGPQEPTLEKQVVYRHLFPPSLSGDDSRDRYDDAALRYIISYLFQAVKRWIAYREWSQDGAAPALNLLRGLRRKDLTKVFGKELDNLESAEVSTSYRSINFYLSLYQIRFEMWESDHRSGNVAPARLLSAGAAFGIFVASSALRHGCAALDKSKADFRPELLDFLPETLSAVAAGRYADVPVVQIYFHCYQVMLAGEDFHFQTLRTLLERHSSLFPAEEIRDVYLVAINYCIRRLNTGAREYVREALFLYRSGLERGILLDNGLLPKATYQNIMQLALALDEWQWARQFLDDYRPALAPGERHNTYHFNLALWHFRKKEYAEAQDILRRVEFRDVYYNMDARRMMVRMYFDTGEVDALDSLLHSFRIYLQRHRNIGYHRELNFNFVRYVQRLIQLEPGDDQGVEKLRRKILNEQYLAERDWLMEKTGEGISST